MKTLLLVLVVFVAGWFARDLVRVAYDAHSRTVSVQVPEVRPAPVRAPRAVPAPSPRAVPVESVEDPAYTAGQSIGQQIQNNGLYNVHPTEMRPLSW